MPGLDDLYREIILDHYRSPRNRGELPVPPARHAEGHNPLCGDEITVYVSVGEDGTVDDVKVSGQGCSISQSSASMMSAAVKGKSLADAEALGRRFKSMLGIDVDTSADDADDDGDGDGDGNGDGDDSAVSLGDLAAMQGVAKFPVRIKCATLAWNTLAEALHAD